jgi:uncharacterized membrane protein
MRKSAKKHNRGKAVRKINTPNLPAANQSSVQQFAQLAVHSGPLPHPSILEDYDRVLPGAAERILAMAESQSNHRQNLEGRYLAAESPNSVWGIICGLFLGLVGLSASGICVYGGHGWPGAALGGVTLASLVGVFVYGTSQRRIEREHKFQLSKPR